MFYLGLIFVKLLALPLSLLPRKMFLILGRRTGFALYKLGFRRHVVESNVRIALPHVHEHEKQRRLFVRKVYSETGVLFLEIIRSFYRFGDFLRRYADVEGAHHLRDALAQGKGVFVMSAHIGNWEVLTAIGPEHFGTKVTMVTKELKPHWVHRIVRVTRELCGVKMACEPQTMRLIMKALKNQEIVGFVMDQFAGAPVGARVPFFGVPVGSHIALATLAARTGAPVVPAISVRKPDGRYLVRFEAPIPLAEGQDPQQTTVLNTANYVRHTEGWIREFPHQWLWIHRRWKGNLAPLPPGSPGELLSR